MSARTPIFVAAIVLFSRETARSDRPSLDPACQIAARTVVLASGLTPEQSLVVSSWMAAAEHPGVLLLDTDGARAANRRFIDELRPAAVVTIDGASESLRRALFRDARQIVVANTKSRRLLLQAACLAAARRAPLFIWHGPEDAELWRRWADDTAADVVLVGVRPAELPTDAPRFQHLSDEVAVQADVVKTLAERHAIETLVVANPADRGLAELAPWVTSRAGAALVLTNDRGDDAGAAVRRALDDPALRHVENLLLLARPGAITTERRPNPVAGKDAFIETEPFTPTGDEPFTLATGRVFHADPGMVAVILARRRLLPPAGSPRTALIASNPGNSLPMLETFSRVSSHELANRGYQTTALLSDNLSARQLRGRLPDADVFLWEGHHNTLINDWGFVGWDEPLRPSVMVLQSCLALTEPKVAPLFDRGAIAVIGSPNRVYSATGGAFSLAYLDALLYEGQSLGGALRNAKNFLLAYGRLKDKRLGSQAKLVGANIRSAWSFTLWGDPSVRLPDPPTPASAADNVRCRVRGDLITLTVPPLAGAEESGRYRVPYRPNERLAGLVRPAADDKKLVPFVFAEVKLPNGTPGATPRLESKLPESSWTFVWDARRATGYVLALPRDGAGELRFRVRWDAAASTEKSSAEHRTPNRETGGE
jgi:hypothetical protein